MFHFYQITSTSIYNSDKFIIHPYTERFTDLQNVVSEIERRTSFLIRNNMDFYLRFYVPALNEIVYNPKTYHTSVLLANLTPNQRETMLSFVPDFQNCTTINEFAKELDINQTLIIPSNHTETSGKFAQNYIATLKVQEFIAETKMCIRRISCTLPLDVTILVKIAIEVAITALVVMGCLLAYTSTDKKQEVVE